MIKEVFELQVSKTCFWTKTEREALRSYAGDARQTFFVCMCMCIKKNIYIYCI